MKFAELKAEVEKSLEKLNEEPNYGFRYQFGGHFDGKDRVLVQFSSVKGTRSDALSKQQMKLAKVALDFRGRIGSVVLFLDAVGDYMLVAAAGETPVLIEGRSVTVGSTTYADGAVVASPARMNRFDSWLRDERRVKRNVDYAMLHKYGETFLFYPAVWADAIAEGLAACPLGIVHHYPY
jgi:hypothetical protein